MWIQDKEIQFGFYFLASWPALTPNQWWHYIITIYWGLMGLLPPNSSQLLYRSTRAKTRAETRLRLSSVSHNPNMTPIIDRALDQVWNTAKTVLAGRNEGRPPIQLVDKDLALNQFKDKPRNKIKTLVQHHTYIRIMQIYVKTHRKVRKSDLNNNESHAKLSYH